jgi:hypothetical protein
MSGDALVPKRAIERGIVRALRDIFGKGQQMQHTTDEGFEIGVPGAVVTVRWEPTGSTSSGVLVSPDRAEQREAAIQAAVRRVGHWDRPVLVEDDVRKIIAAYEQAKPLVPVAENPLAAAIESVLGPIDTEEAAANAVEAVCRSLGYWPAGFSPSLSPTDRGSDERAAG